MSRVNVVLGEAQSKVTPVEDFYCRCLPPKYDCCQWWLGFMTAYVPGCGLYGCCCYGCDKPDCQNVLITGFLTTLTAPCIYGWAAACIIGCRMMGCRCGLQPGQVMRIQPYWMTRADERKQAGIKEKNVKAESSTPKAAPK